MGQQNLLPSATASIQERIARRRCLKHIDQAKDIEVHQTISRGNNNPGLRRKAVYRYMLEARDIESRIMKSANTNKNQRVYQKNGVISSLTPRKTFHMI